MKTDDANRWSLRSSRWLWRHLQDDKKVKQMGHRHGA